MGRGLTAPWLGILCFLRWNSFPWREIEIDLTPWKHCSQALMPGSLRLDRLGSLRLDWLGSLRLDRLRFLFLFSIYLLDTLGGSND